MKYIFLDFDGVISTTESKMKRDYVHLIRRYFSSTQDYSILDESGVFNDINLINRLNKIVDATGAKIVCSTSWRRYNTVEQLNTLLNHYGFTGSVIGTTPILVGSIETKRGDEIQQYVTEHDISDDDYIVIDDKPLIVSNPSRFIQTNASTGITDFDVNRAISLLNNTTESYRSTQMELNEVLDKELDKFSIETISATLEKLKNGIIDPWMLPVIGRYGLIDVQPGFVSQEVLDTMPVEEKENVINKLISVLTKYIEHNYHAFERNEGLDIKLIKSILG